MTAMERNSDVIVMAAYAPLLVNISPGGMQWETDLIGYDAMRSYGSPSYYAQVMFSTYLGDETPDSQLVDGGPKLFYSVTRDTKTKRLYLKLVNAASTPQPIDVKLPGATVANTGKLVMLNAKSTQATNTIDEPTNIVPVESILRNVASDLHYVAPAYSIQVLQIDQR
jgi:alpha-N-arabinofuranosidase